MTLIQQPLFLSARKLAGVHGVRGCAAICVVLFHLHFMLKISLPGIPAKILEQFYLSVFLFFVLSAFTLSHSDRVAPSTYRGYLAKRFFRIAPMFYLMALIASLVSWPRPSVWAVAANATFTFNLFPEYVQGIAAAGWSVGVEMLFYLLFPLLLLVLRNPWSSFGGFVAAMALSSLLWRQMGDIEFAFGRYAYFFIGSNLAIFVAGMWAYQVFAKSERRSAYRIALPIAVILMLVFAFIDPMKFHESLTGVHFSLWGFGFALVCLWQAWFPSRILQSAALQWAGDRSYSIYLIHPWIVYGYERFLHANVVSAVGLTGGYLFLFCAAMTFAVVFFCAEVSYRTIEEPAIRLGSRIAARLNAARG